MTTLILNVDRDNDYGIKAGVDGPVTGYGECYNAALPTKYAPRIMVTSITAPLPGLSK